MKNLELLYKIFCKERKEELSDEPNFKQKRSELEKHLDSTLSSEDFLKAEEIINELEISAEEAGFKSGCRMLSSLYNLPLDQ